MLPAKFYKIFGTRIELTKFALGTYYQWDPRNEQLVLAKPYFIFGMFVGFCGGVNLAIIHCIQIYLKTHPNDIPEEGFSGNNSQKSLDLMDLATLIIQGGELILMTCCTLLNYLFLQRLDIFMHLFNQLLNYNKHLTRLIEEGKLILTDKQRFVVHAAMTLSYAVIGISTFLPFGVMAAFSNEIEPHNQIFREWLEVPAKLTWSVVPLLAMLCAATYGVGTTVGLMCILVDLYFATATICTESIIPIQMTRKPRDGPGRSEIITRGYGTLSDLEVISLYRTQQVFNVLLSSFFRSLLMSFHHVGVLAALVAILVFVVKYNAILTGSGLLAYMFVFSFMASLLLLIFSQCKMGGAVVDISETFKSSGSKIFPRKTLFRKFARSCTIFYIEVTYPFYTIHKETFTGFIHQALDYTIQILLW